MAGFAHVGEYIDALENGKTSYGQIRKVPSQASTAGHWVDLSMAAGQPIAQYYAAAPLEAAVLTGMRGIFHGDDRSPSQKHLVEWSLMTPTAGLVGAYHLLDYLLYYPFVDLDSTDEQALDNTVTLPRYTAGDGVRVMLVAVAPTAGGASLTFNFDYVDQNGNAQTAPTQTFNSTAANIATILSSQQAVSGGQGSPYLHLASGSTGVRSITAWRNVAAVGGLAAVVLVKPLATLWLPEVSTPVELTYPNLKPGPPRVYDGAYLGMIMNCAATVAAGTLAGHVRFAWG